MKNAKRILSLVLLLTVLLVNTALAEMDTHYNITLTSRSITSGTDYTADEMYKFITEKFNIDVEAWAVENSAINEKGRIFVNSGTMPDMMLVHILDYPTYCEWADQGLIAALPENWKEEYPNLARRMEKSLVEEYMTIDGRTYMLPNTTLCNFINYEDRGVNHHCIYYRKDWAEKLGFKFGDTITFSELAAFNKAAVEADLAGNGATVGLTGSVSNIQSNILYFSGIDWDGFTVVDGQYVWSPTQKSVTDIIRMLREWYQEGILNPDYYLFTSSNDGNAAFHAGLAASCYMTGTSGSMTNMINNFAAANPGVDGADYVGIGLLANDEGVVYSAELTNYWQCTLFNPELEKNPEKFERILSLMDWLSDPYEGYLTVNLGMKGKDWDVDSEGNVKVYLDANTKAEKLYPSTNLFKYHTVCTDDAGLFTSYVPQMCTDKANLHYKLKRAGFVIPFDYGFEYLRDESKNNYSVDVASQVTSLIVDSTLDIDTEWAKFIEANRGIWQPVVDALNAELLMK